MTLRQTGAGPLSPLADPDPLPPVPFLEQHLLTWPWGSVVVLALAGACAWWMLQQAGKPRPAWAALAGGTAAAVAVAALAHLVITQREALRLRTADLVSAATAPDRAALDALLRDDLTITVLGRRFDHNKARVLQFVTVEGPARYKVGQSQLRWATATLDGQRSARTQCRVIVPAPWDNASIPTTWLIHWARDDDTAPWRVRTIEAQQIGFMPPNSVGSF